MPLLHQVLLDLISSSKNLPESFTIADFGCSSRPHPLLTVTEITSFIYKRCHELGRSLPEFWVYLNEFPGYDFNTVFKSLPEYHAKLKEENGPDFRPLLYISAVPGPCHERLFPSKSLHFVHSSSTLNWLSQVPPELTDKENPLINKGKIFISKTSPPAVIKAYQTQFQSDFASFLESRSKEVVPGGRMVLTFRGRTTPDPSSDETCLLWDYLGQAFQDLIEKGLIEEEKLDTYNIPYYEPYIEEIKAEIEKQGSFMLDHLVINSIPTAQMIGNATRADHETTIRSHFGSETVDRLFQRFSEVIAANTKEVELIGFVVSVTRK
ncbi:hypothetical protein Q3G72_004080 [Acer saccharum]|nr:hypothetical protein Q3G72_004080 [Acer saccharum]